MSGEKNVSESISYGVKREVGLFGEAGERNTIKKKGSQADKPEGSLFFPPQDD